MEPVITPSASRRDFIKTAAKTTAGLSVLSGVSLPHVWAAEDNTVRVALVGCGGRGTGAARNSMSLKAPTRLIAMADVLENRMEGSFQQLSEKYPDRFSVSVDSKFIGFDAYKHAIDSLQPGRDVVIMATPPAFRWVQFKYAIEKGVNVFMEKPICVDGPTGKRMLALGEEAKKKNMKVGVGLMCRHCDRRQELYDRIQQGEIGDIILARAYRMQGPVGTCFTPPRDPKVEPSELLWQIKNFHSFLWASGGSYSDFFIHNIDEACWMKNDWPVEAKASCGRSNRGENIDQNMDTYSIEYTWADGSKFYFDGRNQIGVHNEFATYVHGSKGMAVVSTAGHFPSKAMIFKGQNKDNRENLLWRAKQPEPDPYQLEWEDLVDAIQNDKPYNEVERGAKASLVTAMGRHAAHTGQIVTYDEFVNNPHEFAPGADKLTLDGPAPLKANAEGKYPIPQPGIVKDREYAVA